MSPWVTFVRRLRALVQGGRLDQELDEELRFHLEQQVELNVARGITPAEARRAESPLGRSIRVPDVGSKEIVGVVGDVRQRALSNEPRAEIYLPYAQHQWRSCFLLVRSDLDPAGLAPALRREIRAIDTHIALSGFRSMEDQISTSLSSPRFHTMVLDAFAALALTLAAVGVFGVISYATSQRARDFAIRLALGAERSDILRLVIGKGFLPALLGVGLGLALSLVLARSLSSLLFDVGPTDPTTHAAVAALLSGVAMLACYLPSRRATRIDPAVALRDE